MLDSTDEGRLLSEDGYLLMKVPATLPEPPAVAVAVQPAVRVTEVGTVDDAEKKVARDSLEESETQLSGFQLRVNAKTGLNGGS